MRVVSLFKGWASILQPELDPSIELVDFGGDLPAFATQAREQLRGTSLTSRAERDAALATAEVVVAAEFDAVLARVCPSLRLLICPLAGTEGIDRSVLAENVRVVSGVGHEIPMAEYVMGCITALREHLLDADATLHKGEWKYGFWGTGRASDELYASTLGLVGFGRIGAEIAKRARAFGMRCGAVTLHPSASRQAEAGLEFLTSIADAEDVDRLVAWSDALVLCSELSPLTQGLLDARRLSLMKQTSLVVNVSRGAVAVERDLYEALAQQQIAGAAMDVWYRYPEERGSALEPNACFPSSYPFQDLPNVIMTPHMSAWTEAARKRRVDAIAREINEFGRSVARERTPH